MDVWERVAERRTDLLAQLERLTAEQWETQSLCTEWRVRHVVAHVSFPERYPIARTLLAVARAGGSIPRYVRDDALARGSGTTSQVLDAYREAVPHRAVPPGRRPENVLVDLLLHSQDIRRPLQLQWSNPPDVMLIALPTLHPDKTIGVTRRVAGLRLVATDVGWSAGEGAELRGPADALLLTMAGRAAALTELEGPGKEVLAARL